MNRTIFNTRFDFPVNNKERYCPIDCIMITEKEFLMDKSKRKKFFGQEQPSKRKFYPTNNFYPIYTNNY